MIRKISLLMVFIGLTSCHSARYTTDYRSTPYGLNFKQGTWLLNEVDAPFSIKEKMLKLATKMFEKHLDNRLSLAKERTDFALSYIPMHPNTRILEQAKRETNFDFLINIKGTVINYDIGSLQLGDIDAPQSNVSETILEVYDLNTLEIILTKRVLGTVYVKESSMDFAIAKSGNALIIGGLKTILKNLDR